MRGRPDDRIDVVDTVLGRRDVDARRADRLLHERAQPALDVVVLHGQDRRVPCRLLDDEVGAEGLDGVDVEHGRFDPPLGEPLGGVQRGPDHDPRRDQEDVVAPAQHPWLAGGEGHGAVVDRRLPSPPHADVHRSGGIDASAQQRDGARPVRGREHDQPGDRAKGRQVLGGVV